MVRVFEVLNEAAIVHVRSQRLLHLRAVPKKSCQDASIEVALYVTRYRYGSPRSAVGAVFCGIWMPSCNYSAANTRDLPAVPLDMQVFTCL
jgi:hypothetical protein